MNIEIDFEVFKALTALRTDENVSYNDVLRELLGLHLQKKSAPLERQKASNEGWVTKGVRFPNGTEFRATYKGQTYHGRVESGALVFNNSRFLSPSAAAMEITANPVNGWTFWECRMPGDSSWKIIKSLRK